jgi:hypothetical protein
MYVLQIQVISNPKRLIIISVRTLSQGLPNDEGKQTFCLKSRSKNKTEKVKIMKQNANHHRFIQSEAHNVHSNCPPENKINAQPSIFIA